MSAFGKAWGLAFGAAFGLVVAVPPAEIAPGGGLQKHVKTQQRSADKPELTLADITQAAAKLVAKTPDTKAPAAQPLPGEIVGRKDFAQLFVAPGVDIAAAPAIPSGIPGSAGSVGEPLTTVNRLTPEPTPQSGAIPPLYTFSAKQPLETVDSAGAAIDFVATTEGAPNGPQTPEAVQTAQEGPAAQSSTDDARLARLRADDEALAMILILMEATA